MKTYLIMNTNPDTPLRGYEPLRGAYRAVMIYIATIGTLFTQAQTLSLQDALTKAEQNSAQVQAALLDVDKNKMLEKSAFNLYQPQLLVEAPTGNFYTLGVQQQFDFPTVYGARKKLLRSQTGIAEANASLTKAEVRFMIADLYLQWQTAEAKVKFYTSQQTNFNATSEAAVRSFNAGEIDFLEKSFAELKAQEVMRQLELSTAERNAAKQSMLMYIGADENSQSDSLGTNLQLSAWGTTTLGTSKIAVAQAELTASEQALKLQKNQNLPGFFLGYMNQGESNSPLENRFNAGISIPLWFWHQSASTKAARLNVEQSQKELLAVQQQVNQLYISTLALHDATVTSLGTVRTTSLLTSKKLADAALRMKEAGEISLTEYLRLISEASQTEIAHIELMQQLIQSQHQLQFLTSAQ
ncbi:MAG: TolC family protein [Flavobacteriales bacterium]|nr:TolC family protein [Flavobacteriales bacterium]